MAEASVAYFILTSDLVINVTSISDKTEMTWTSKVEIYSTKK
jgi:hypothetical protein